MPREEGAYQNDIFGLGVTFLENCGFSIWDKFNDREDIQLLRRQGRNAEANNQFKNYMENFDLDVIRIEVQQFVIDNSSLSISSEIINLALDMMKPADQRPNIDQVVAQLDQINKPTVT